MISGAVGGSCDFITISVSLQQHLQDDHHRQNKSLPQDIDEELNVVRMGDAELAPVVV